MNGLINHNNIYFISLLVEQESKIGLSLGWFLVFFWFGWPRKNLVVFCVSARVSQPWNAVSLMYVCI